MRDGIKGVASKVAWAARATTTVVGLAIMLALVLGVASAALGANGKPFVLGKGNVATKVSALTNKGLGAALSLNVQDGQPPLAVNSQTRVDNLNADQLDGKSAEDFQAAGSTAADADTLDGKDSTEFSPASHGHDERYYTEAEADGRFVNEADHNKAAHDAMGLDAGTLDGRDSSAFLVTGDGRAYGDARVNSCSVGVLVSYPVTLSRPGRIYATASSTVVPSVADYSMQPSLQVVLRGASGNPVALGAQTFAAKPDPALTNPELPTHVSGVLLDNEVIAYGVDIPAGSYTLELQGQVGGACGGGRSVGFKRPTLSHISLAAGQ